MFLVYNRKIGHHRRIHHTGISLDIEFQFKQTILMFQTEFAKNGYFWYKKGRLIIIPKLNIFKLV